ncbi:tRNA (adenine37-N(6))-methyltransferase trmN6 [Vibrio ishigakensis]|nr:tRNA (adenine37-N(6))-methyltransferase trmN6 [Vibrio ishigakensis]
MNQTTKDFEFKRFTIIGGKSGMPVSTDGVLLGAWADIKMVGSILDIGTGTGLLA